MSANGKHESGDGHANQMRMGDDEDRKLFLGGLSWETGEEDLRNYFNQFGQVDQISIKYDSVTGNPRGFGFITFTDEASIDKVLAIPTHTVKEKQIDPKRAKSRPICKKIFVGGIDANLSEDEIRKFFSKYGKVEGIELPFDRARGKRREFCFIIFEAEEAADEACKDAKQMIGGRECDVKKAQPQPVAQQQKRLNQQTQGYEGGPPQGGSGRGRGRGGGRPEGYNSGGGGSYDQQGWGAGYGTGGAAGQAYSGYPAQGYPGYAAAPGGGYGYSGYPGAPAGYGDYYNQYYGQGYGDYWNQYYGGAGGSGYGPEGEYPGYGSQGSQDSYAGGPASQGTSQSHPPAGPPGGKIPAKSGTSRGPSSYHPYGGRGSSSGSH
ncbi:RNA-binding protein squid [Halotydeus destructor]|nr:RNA-binding protein squid [Halotydeus destructor]